MNTITIACLIGGISEKIAHCENQVKTLSQIIQEKKLEPMGVTYFSARIQDYTTSIKELKELITILDANKWEKVKEEFSQ